MKFEQRFSNLNWSVLGDQLSGRGYAVIDQLCSAAECQQLLQLYSQPLFRKTVSMARHNFGNGEYKYFSYPLPPLVQQMRTAFYSPLARLANDWAKLWGDDHKWPLQYQAFLDQCRSCDQIKATPLMLKYVAGDYNRLHQDLYGEVYFPFQLIVLLSEPEQDYQGGDLVLVENYPRLQSRPHVPKLRKGSAVIVPTQERPIAGAKTWRRAKIRHGVSELLAGERLTLGIIFHDA